MSNFSRIPCCLCATLFEPNDAGICIDCLRTQSDISDCLDSSVDIVRCGKCDKWNVSRNHWMHHELESASLLAACLRMIPGIPKVKIIDAAWIWTEPHSKRMKIGVEIEKGVLDEKVKLRQRVVVEFIVKNKQCLDCIREATDHTWGAQVQLRQHVSHKKSLLTLENALLKSGLTETILNIQTTKDGIDLYFKSKALADRVTEYISCALPCKLKASKKLVSRDLHSNISKYEYTTYIEVAPLCRGDLVVLPKTAKGSKSALMVVEKVASCIHLINPQTLQRVELTAHRYFTNPIYPLLSSSQLVPYVVLDIVPLETAERIGPSESPRVASAPTSVSTRGGVLAEAVVTREVDLGENDVSFRVVTHLGHILQPGDVALGYDISHVVWDDGVLATLTHHSESELSIEVVLIKKSYPEKKPSKKKSRRISGRKVDRNAAKSAGGAENEDDLIDNGSGGEVASSDEEDDEISNDDTDDLFDKNVKGAVDEVLLELGSTDNATEEA